MNLYEKNSNRINRFRSKLVKKIKTYLQRHENQVEILLQGDISLDGTLDDNDDEFIAYIYTSVKMKDGDFVAEGYSYFIGDDIQTPCSVDSDALSINELVNIMYCLK